MPMDIMDARSPSMVSCPSDMALKPMSAASVVVVMGTVTQYMVSIIPPLGPCFFASILYLDTTCMPKSMPIPNIIDRPADVAEVMLEPRNPRSPNDHTVPRDMARSDVRPYLRE